MHLYRNMIGAVATAVLASSLTVLGASAAQADVVDDFYVPPAQLADSPGSVVRTQPMSLFAALPGTGGSYPAQAQRVLYTSRTQDDAPVAVSGTFIETEVPWRGAGPRPTIVVAPGTVGQGDQCAPSRAFPTSINAVAQPLSISFNQELLSSTLWGSTGANVFVTDYIGLGTPGLHTYVNRVEEAHAVLDGARAATELAGDANAPIGIWGYSQGGGAAAAAAELAGEYAPELNVKGTWAGAPTADLLEVLKTVDGTLIGGVIGYALNGFVERDSSLLPLIDERLTDHGKAVLDDLSTQCIGDTILKYPFLKTESLTVDGRSMLENLGTIPEAGRILDEQRIGRSTPNAPVMITSGLNDDTVPYGQARQLAQDWCGRGASVEFRTNPLPPILQGAVLPNHFGPQLIDGYGGQAASFLMDRFADLPVSACTLD
uniref:lipase family protein n=1 Tax=unclassified Rhodococcus (in: high G+C Gram-positive bacteria) TaxID=192944 RepID=UPI0020CDB173|nr:MULTISPECIES: lipase family protein [unclassified Rhodococcus (in: high G+C Gram-positive bacteria)]